MPDHEQPETPPAKPEDSTPAPPRRLRISELLQKPFDVRAFALTGLFVLAVFYTMYFTRAILLPLVLALLLSQLFAPIVRALARWRIPQMVGAALVLLALCGSVAYGISVLSTPAAGWLEKAPYGISQLKAKVEPLLRRPMQRMKEASGEMSKIGGQDQSQKVVEVQQKSVISDLAFTRTPEFIGSTLSMLILLYFLLGYSGVFLGKLVKVIPKFADKKKAVTIANDIEEKISAYLLNVTMINIGLGATLAGVLFLLGMPNPLLWGVAATILNFVPYLGAFVGILTMTVAALLSFNSLAHALIFPGVYLVLTTIEGNFITPMILGRSLTLNPVAIVLSLMFWGWMWGIVGVILAVPILATCKILCDHIEPLAQIGEFLSD